MQTPVKLNHEEIVEVKPTSPFAFDPTFHKPDHFTSGDNLWKPGTLKNVSEEQLRALKVGYRIRF